MMGMTSAILRNLTASSSLLRRSSERCGRSARSSFVRSTSLRFFIADTILTISAICAGERPSSSGGGSVSPLWRQMQADIFDLPVYTMSASGEGGAYGAILVAGVGAGVWGSLEEAASIIQVETETLPIRENQKAYQDAYSLYCELYGALKPVYDKGAALAL